MNNILEGRNGSLRGQVIAMVDPKGIIVTYHIAYTKEVLVRVPGINSKRDAAKLVGQKAVWTDEKGQKYAGVVMGMHGTGGTIKVKFRDPLPSKALAKPINIGG
jgi:ribosomal protein L35AE/L33A